ncbi:MAG: hypothetical protein JXB10_14430 [Pirellulales bacterium]|nr:hypothetical protein [Pirellulales bacterium]
MASSIIGIPTTRVSNIFIRQRLLSQLQFDMTDLLHIQMQLSTGRRFEAPSEDPVAALRIVGLQRLLERKAQVQSNLNNNQSYLTTADSSLASISELLSGIRGEAISVLGTISGDLERETVIQEIDNALQQLVQTGNQRYRGRYLFSGSEASRLPFQMTGSSLVEYFGNCQHLYSYSDINQLFNTNLTGDEVFGALSSAVMGTTTITPTLTYDTLLADLRQGEGISKGAILVSDGVHPPVTIDISGAETIGDLAELIKSHPPMGRELFVDVTADRLTIRLDPEGGGNLFIREVGSGTVANELGILCETGAGTDPIEGRALNPILRGTTALTQLFGAYASTVVHSHGVDNDVRLTADVMGERTADEVNLNGVRVEWVTDLAVNPGGEFVEYDPGVSLRVHVAGNGTTRASRVVEVINDAHDAGTIPFTAEIDPLDDVNGGHSFVQGGAWADTRDGANEALDQTSGLRITNRGQEYTISLLSAQTLEDVLNIINGSGAGVRAEINAAKNGINLRSQCSGCDFCIGENGGQTAAQLGIRSMTEATLLSDLNFGRGVQHAAGGDFTITRSDGAVLSITLGDVRTLGEVLSLINDDPNNADGLLVARLAQYGNGIELIDSSGGAGDLLVTREFMSSAASDLGLIPPGVDQSAPGTGDPKTLTGSDVNPREVEGMFTALTRLRNALQNNDLIEAQRAIGLLDSKTVDLNFARADLGARQNSLDVIKERLDTENIELQKILSLEYDADITEAVTQLTARQATYEASLQSIAKIFQVTLLDYL